MPASLEVVRKPRLVAPHFEVQRRLPPQGALSERVVQVYVVHPRISAFKEIRVPVEVVLEAFARHRLKQKLEVLDRVVEGGQCGSAIALPERLLTAATIPSQSLLISRHAVGPRSPADARRLLGPRTLPRFRAALAARITRVGFFLSWRRCPERSADPRAARNLH